MRRWEGGRDGRGEGRTERGGEGGSDGGRDLDLDLGTHLRAHRTPGAEHDGVPTTLQIGRPCHMKCTLQVLDGPLPVQSPWASLAPGGLGPRPTEGGREGGRVSGRCDLTVVLCTVRPLPPMGLSSRVLWPAHASVPRHGGSTEACCCGAVKRPHSNPISRNQCHLRLCIAAKKKGCKIVVLSAVTVQQPQ